MYETKRIHRIDSCSNGLDEDLVWSWFRDSKILHYLPWSTRSFDNNTFHCYSYNKCLYCGFRTFRCIRELNSSYGKVLYFISLHALEHKQVQAKHSPGRHCYVGRFIMLKSPSIEATSLIDLDHWRRLDVRAGWKPGGWVNHGSWLAIQSKQTGACLSNNDLIVPQSISGIG